MKRNDGPERVLQGLAVSPGVALGPAHVVGAAALSVPEYTIEEGAEAQELERFDAAVATARSHVAKLKDKSAALHGDASEEIGAILDAHLAMLGGSRLLRGAQRRIVSEHVNAEAAIRHEVQALVDSFAEIDDAYLAARAEDVRAVGQRIIRTLLDVPHASVGQAAKGAVLLADELTPADTALIDPSAVTAFATVSGGADSHTAIMARALGLPAVLGCGGLMEAASQGSAVFVDGFAGTVTVNPSPETLARYRLLADRFAREKEGLQRLSQLPAVTADGFAVTLQANIELPLELEPALAAGAAGIGLLRTEFLFMNRDAPPSEDEQTQALEAIVRGMGGREVTIRTLDIGGDKLAFPIEGITDSPNPALGLRAIRLGLKSPELLETQFAAILRVARLWPVRILLLMISTLTQVRRARILLEQTARRLAAEGVSLPDQLPALGVMIEVPGAALAADAFARESAFFAIGTNDLTQYTLAIDRADDQLAEYYNPAHPAVLRLIQFTVSAGQRAGIPVSVCGELAGDPRYTALLLGLGVRTLSMASSSLGRVKQHLRGLTLPEATDTARRVMAESDEETIGRRLNEGVKASASEG